MFNDRMLGQSEARTIPLRLLAHLGDAVFDLYVRELEILNSISARQLHHKVTAIVRAVRQAELLDSILPRLDEREAEVVRRARNLKPAGYRRSGQGAYRKATAFEALVGYLYLTDRERLRALLKACMDTPLAAAESARDS
ncbi:MAG TPA: ribonuclease III domain-containing protein [Candidatus Obscuribacterales bacterium]